MTKNIQNIAIKDIVVSEMNSRKTFDEKSLNELAESIKEVGIIQPITTRVIDGKHQIVCGERRYRASKIAKLKTIPCIVEDLTDEEVVSYVMIENLQREDIKPVEEAFYFGKLIEQGKSVQEIATKIGKSHVFVHGRLVLNDLIDGFKELLEQNVIDLRTSMLVASYKPQIQAKMLDKEFSATGWNSLLSENFASIKKSLESRYNYALSTANFDTTACVGCKFNSRCATLFEEEVQEESQCSNYECYEEKRSSANADLLLKLLAKLGTSEVYSNYIDDTIKPILEEHSVTIINKSAYCSSPVEPFKDDFDAMEEEQRTKAIQRYEEKLEEYLKKTEEIQTALDNGELVECVAIYSDRIYIAYNYPPKTEEKKAEEVHKAHIFDLKSKIVRNTEIQKEKTIEDIKGKVLTHNAQFGTHNLDELEEHLLYLFLADHLGSSQKDSFAKEKDTYWVDLNQLDKKVQNITDENKNWLKRTFIAECLRDCANAEKGVRGDYLLNFAELHFEHETEMIKEDYRAVYDKRNEKLEDRIREYQANNGLEVEAF